MNARTESMTEFSTLRAIPAMDTVGLRNVMKAAAEGLTQKMGPIHAAKVFASVANEIRSSRGGPMTLPEIAFAVAQKHDVMVADLQEPHDKPGACADRYSEPRQEAFWLARRQMRDGKHVHSLYRIGQFFGGRDHSTVSFGVHAHAKRMAMEPAA